MYFTRRAALSTLAAALVLALPERALASRLSTLLPADAADTSNAVHPIVPTAATQAVVVNAASWGTSSATVTAYRWTSGSWVAEIGPVPAGIGYAGFTAAPHEADGFTPIGMYTFTTVFGSRPDPGALFPYVQATSNDHWVDDPSSAVYNTWQTGPSAGRWQSAETMSSYAYAAAFDFNQNPVVPNGNSAIFLHGGGGATPGCVEIAQTPLLAILRWLDPAASPVIVLGVDAAPPPHVDPAPVPEDPTVAVATRAGAARGPSAGVAEPVPSARRAVGAPRDLRRHTSRGDAGNHRATADTAPLQCPAVDDRPAAIARFTWDRLTATCAASFLLLVSGLSVGVVLGEMRTHMHLSGVIAAAHGATFGVGLLVFGTFGLPLIARVGRNRVFWSACGAIVVGVGMLCAGTVWPVTLAGTAVAGFACAMLVMLMPGILADHHGEGRAAAFAAVNGVPGLAGIAISLVVGGALALGWTWRWPYAAITLVLALGLVIVGRGVRIPVGGRQPAGHVLALFRDRAVLAPWLGIVHAVLVEYTVAVFNTVYLKEVGHASGGLAATLAGCWGLSILLSRMWITRFVARFGAWSRSAGFAVAAVGVMTMWSSHTPAVCASGLIVSGLGAGVLYPLAVERLYERDGADTMSLGAVAALGSGTAVTVGPMLAGVLADSFSVRNAILFVPVLAVIGIVLHAPNRPARRQRLGPAESVRSAA